MLLSIFKPAVQAASIAAVLAAAVAAPQAARALTSTSVVIIAAQTNYACTTATQNASSVIPNYDVFANASSDDVASTGSTFSVTCTKGTGPGPTVGVSAGGHASGSQRRLADGSVTHFLNYNICQNAACSATGDPVSTTSKFSLTFGGSQGSSSTANWSLFPIVLKGQNQPAGTYTDTVNVTVNY